MNKNIFYFWSLLLIAPLLEGQESIKKEPISPETTIIMFDIDEVILIRNTPIKKILWDNWFTLVKNPRLAWKFLQLYRSGNAAGGDYIRLCRQEKNEAMAKIIEKITLDKSLNPGIAEFIKQLQDEGFTLHIASNMSRDDFNFFIKKFPEVFSRFACVKVIDYKDKQAPAKKPDLAYFNEYLQECPSDKKRLFFDDKKKNINAARQVGIDGIVVTSVEQLIKDFNALRTISYEEQAESMTSKI